MAKYKSQIIVSVFLFGVLFCSLGTDRNTKDIRLIGQWCGKTDDISISITFREDSGVIAYLPYNRKVPFRYRIKQDSILSISSGRNKSLHLIEFLSKDKFILLPYPKKWNSEMIDVIDQVEFARRYSE